MKNTMTGNMWLVFALLSVLSIIITIKSALGCILIAAGTLLMVL